MKYNVFYFTSDKDKKEMELVINLLILPADSPDEARKKALEVLEKNGIKDIAISHITEAPESKLMNGLLQEAENRYDTYEKKIARGREIMESLMGSLVYNESQLLAFFETIRAVCHHLSKVDDVMSFREFSFFYDAVALGSRYGRKTKKDYEEFLKTVKKNKKGAEADIAAGKKFIEGVLLADHFDDATKFAMLQLAALFVTVDGEVTEQEQEYLSELCEKAMN